MRNSVKKDAACVGEVKLRITIGNGRTDKDVEKPDDQHHHQVAFDESLNVMDTRVSPHGMAYLVLGPVP